MQVCTRHCTRGPSSEFPPVSWVGWEGDRNKRKLPRPADTLLHPLSACADAVYHHTCASHTFGPTHAPLQWLPEYTSERWQRPLCRAGMKIENSPPESELSGCRPSDIRPYSTSLRMRHNLPSHREEQGTRTTHGSHCGPEAPVDNQTATRSPTVVKPTNAPQRECKSTP